jgi:hypothetical protein
MKGFLIFMPIIFAAFAAVFGMDIFRIRRHVSKLQVGYLSKKIVEFVLYSIVFVIIFQSVIGVIQSNSNSFIYNLFCSFSHFCDSRQEQSPLPTHNSDDPIKKADIVHVCTLSLNSRHDGWSEAFEMAAYVLEAKRRLKSIDDCRRVLGLSPLADIDEPARLRVLDNSRLCAEAIDRSRSDWSWAKEAQSAVTEALVNRRLTKEDCLAALGVPVTVPEGSPFVLPMPPPVSLAPEFPTGRIKNAKSPYTNLRDNPGRNSRVVMRLENGTKVILLGTKLSPNSGHPYCRVLTESGTPGYVDHELVDGSCFLNLTQSNYLMDIDRQDRLEAFRLFRDLAIIGLGIVAITR